MLSLVVPALSVAVIGSLIVSGTKKDNTLTLTYAEINPLGGTPPKETAKAFNQKTEELLRNNYHYRPSRQAACSEVRINSLIICSAEEMSALLSIHS